MLQLTSYRHLLWDRHRICCRGNFAVVVDRDHVVTCCLQFEVCGHTEARSMLHGYAEPEPLHPTEASRT